MPASFSPKKIISLLITFFISAGLSYVFTPVSAASLLNPTSSNQSETDLGNAAKGGQFAGEAKTEICPLNGLAYTKSEKNLWESRRPILAMIENDIHARPQSGLSLADIVYEAVAEGGITRFMAVMYCGAQGDTARVAPVRSARIYFVNIAAEYSTPIYMHVGGGNCSRDEASNQCTSDKRAWAIEELAKLGWRKPGGNDFDTTSDTGYPVLLRDYNRLGADVELATEHTMVGSLPSAWREAEKRKFTAKMPDDTRWLDNFKPWKIDEKAVLAGTPATDINFDFWVNYKDFSTNWKYDSAQKLYVRSQGGKPAIDLDNQLPLVATNLIIQQVEEAGPIDIHKHMLYDVIGKGTGYYFQSGQVIPIKWSKANQKSRTVYTDSKGKEITFLPGKIWIELTPAGSPINYQ